MNGNLFRKKNLERVSSPEQLDDYIHVSNPSAWLVLASFVILLIGICIWGIFGRLDTKVSVVAMNSGEGVVCYLREQDRASVEEGMAVRIGSIDYSITGIEKNPVLVDSSFEEYAKHIGGFGNGEWVYCVYTDCEAGTEGEIFAAEIIIESINPIYFVTN